MYFMFVVFFLHSDKNQDFTINMCKASSSKKCIVPSRSTNSLVILQPLQQCFRHTNKCFLTNSGEKMLAGKNTFYKLKQKVLCSSNSYYIIS